MFGPILQKFAEKTPITVMVQGLLERLLNADKMDNWFESVCNVQYTKKILFSSIISLMLEVVCKTKNNVYSAYLDSEIEASRQAVYDKLKNIETNTSREIVRYIADEAEEIVMEIGGYLPALLPGFRTKFLDGNCIEGTEHRLKPLRETKAGALPGKSLVVFDPQIGIAIDVFPCENGHAQERSLLPNVIETINNNDLWVADRNFCVLNFMFEVNNKSACFIIRQHASTPYNTLSEEEFIKDSETGKIYEQKVSIEFEGKEIKLRRIIVKLNKITRNGDNEIYLLTNLSTTDADAMKIAHIYGKRWNIETAFQKLEGYLNSEINTLGYPKAALFGFCMALVAFNIYAVVMATLRAAYPDKNIDDEVSDYYIADEISCKINGMNLILEEEDWSRFVETSVPELAIILLYLAKQVNLKRFKKSKRGPKKPSPPKNKFKGKPHVATVKLLV